MQRRVNHSTRLILKRTYLAVNAGTAIVLHYKLQCLIEPSVLTVATMENVAVRQIKV